MKLYVWKDLDYLTDNYHNGGGLLIVTNRNPMEVLMEYYEPFIDEEKPTIEKLKEKHGKGWLNYCRTPWFMIRDFYLKYPDILSKPMLVLEIVHNEELVIIFPDTGCC